MITTDFCASYNVHEDFHGHYVYLFCKSYFNFIFYDSLYT